MATDLGLIDITDSTDWLSTEIPAFAPVEASLRCEICKDFYKTPMITECDHTFCSLCIRRILDDTSKCPLCLTITQQVKLRKCAALENTLEAFSKARTDLLSFCQNRPPPPPPVLSQHDPATSPVSKRSHSQTVMSSPVTAESPRRSKRLRSSAKRIASYHGADLEEIVVLDMPPEKEQDTDYRDEDEKPLNDGLVACPICGKRMKEVLVSNHLDTTCGQELPSPPRKPTATPAVLVSRTNPFLRHQAPLTRAPDRLPALNYSLLKDNALRKKMSELGISTSGTRSLLEKRHREWTTLWNANCDSARPKRKVELLRDLEQWERTIANPKPCFAARSNGGVDIKDKDFDGTAWSMKHESSFQDLIANARRTRQQAQRKQDPGTIENTPSEHAPIVIDLSTGSGEDRVIAETPPPDDDNVTPRNIAEIPSSSQMSDS